MSNELNARIVQCAHAWRLSIERTAVTATSVLAFGTSRGRSAVLKVVKEPGDEWHCGAVAAAFGARAVVRAYEHMPGAALFERLTPGTPLATLAQDGRDAEATEILATLLGRMSPLDPPATCPTVEAWGGAFERFLASEDDALPRSLVEYAQRVYRDLCRTERNPSLLHGDLHHYNVLFDERRGWLAIDPKGVIGELEYEIGASLRNPFDRPELVATLDTVERRLAQFGASLGVDVSRARGWTFAQAVLSTIWDIEDGAPVTAGHSALELARTLEGSAVLREDF